MRWIGSLLVCLLLFSSCGYHLSSSKNSIRGKRISVPYIDGDLKGEFTSELTHSVSRAGAILSCSGESDYILCVQTVDQKERHVGFRYDRDQGGALTQQLQPAETRLSVLIKISLIDSCSGCCVKGPIPISASLDFDHDLYTSRDGVNILSLGQLTDIYAARDAAMKPIYRMLSQKIVDYLNNDWSTE